MVIRFADIDESSAIASVLREAFSMYEPYYTAAAFAATSPSASTIEERWNEGPVWDASLHDDKTLGLKIYYSE